jgi:hypothetical protein
MNFQQFLFCFMPVTTFYLSSDMVPLKYDQLWKLVAVAQA